MLKEKVRRIPETLKFIISIVKIYEVVIRRNGFYKKAMQ